MKFTILLALTAAGASVAAVGSNKSGLRSLEDQVSNGYELADFFGRCGSNRRYELSKFTVHSSATACFAHHCDHALDF